MQKTTNQFESRTARHEETNQNPRLEEYQTSHFNEKSDYNMTNCSQETMKHHDERFKRDRARGGFSQEISTHQSEPKLPQDLDAKSITTNDIYQLLHKL